MALELMHEFMEFYRMDYTSNVFVHEANYKASTERQALSKFNLMIVNKLNIGPVDQSKPLLASIIEKLVTGVVTKSSSGTVQLEKNLDKLPLEKPTPALPSHKETIQSSLAELKGQEEQLKAEKMHKEIQNLEVKEAKPEKPVKIDVSKLPLKDAIVWKQGTGERKNHRHRHGAEHFSFGARERQNRQINDGDDEHPKKHRAGHLLAAGEHFA